MRDWKRTDDLVLEKKGLELRVDGDPDVESQSRRDDDDEHHPGPIPDVEADEQVRGGDGASSDSRAEFPEGEVVTSCRMRGRPRKDKVRHTERDGGLVQAIEHIAEEPSPGPFFAEDAATIKLRVSHRRLGVDVLVEDTENSDRQRCEDEVEEHEKGVLVKVGRVEAGIESPS